MYKKKFYILFISTFQQSYPQIKFCFLITKLYIISKEFDNENW